MEQNKGFWYADWSFPIFVGLLSSGVFAGTHMYYLYGIGAFNEVAFVAMLKSAMAQRARDIDATFPENAHAEIVDGRLILRKPPRSEVVEAATRIDALITERMEAASIVDIMIDTER